MRVCRYSQVGKSGGGGDVGVAVGMIVKLKKCVSSAAAWGTVNSEGHFWEKDLRIWKSKSLSARI